MRLPCTQILVGPVLLLAVVALESAGAAQTPERKVVLSGEDARLAGRLVAIDRLVDPLSTAEMLASNVGCLAQPLTWLPAATSRLAESSSPERWEQIIAEYERWLHGSEDVLVPRGADGSPVAAAATSVQVRRLAHERLAQLPPSLLDAYCKRIDDSANRLLLQGQDRREPAPLRKLVDEMYCSPRVDQALDLLGSLAFERGQFGETLHWWNQLEAKRRQGDKETRRQGDLTPALVRAKLILAQAFLGDVVWANREFDIFRTQFADAKGHLAGRDGNLVEILQETLGPGGSHPGAAHEESGGGNHRLLRARLLDPSIWPTYSGSNSRQQVLPDALPPRLWADGPTWRCPLSADAQMLMSQRPGRQRQAAFHPAIVDDQVLLADCCNVYAYHLLTGKPLWQFNLKAAGLSEPSAKDIKADLKDAGDFTPQFTVSASAGRVFVRLGKLNLARTDQPGDGVSYLVCLDGRAEPREGPDSGNHPAPHGARLASSVWHVALPTPDWFEGSPVVREDRVYIAQSKVVGQRTHTALACYDANTGRIRWLVPVCDTPEFEGGEGPRARHNLLTLTNGQLVYCSHAGAIVAVDPWSGRRLWGVRYPSRGRVTSDGSPSPRGLAPCLFHDDRLYVAPLDCDRLFCMDPSSGTILWEQTGIEVVDLLGVSHGKLLFTTSSGLRAINAINGTDQDGWTQPAVGKLPSLGRGLLTGDWVLWPTQDPQLPMRAVAQETGSQETADGFYTDPTQLRGLLAGNMACVQDCLAVAGVDELAVYIAPKRLLKKYQDGHPRSPADLYRFALALLDAERSKEASAALDELARFGPDWKILARQCHLELPDSPVVVQQAPLKAKRLEIGTKVSTLDLPLQRRWEVSGCRHLLHSTRPWDADYFLSIVTDSDQTGEPSGRSRRIACRKFATGEVLWTQDVPFAPAWADHRQEVIVLAGSDGIQALKREDGQPLWYFPSPAVVSQRMYLRDEAPFLFREPGELGGFELAGEILLACYDQRHLFAFDFSTGRLVWHRWSPGGAIRPLSDSALFQFNPVVTSLYTLIHLSHGKRLLLNTQSGSVLAEADFPPQTCPRSLLLNQGNKACLALARGVIILVDLSTGKELWTFKHSWPTSLTGEPAQLLETNGILLTVFSLNQGPELQRLDPDTGKPVWSEPILLPATFDASRVGLSTSACYYVLEDRLYCRSLAEGKLLWQRVLPASARRWQVRLQGQALVVYPDEPPVLPPLPTGILGGLAGPILTYPLICNLIPMPPSEFALWILDPSDGSPLQCLAASPGRAQVLLASTGIVVRNRECTWGFH